MVVIRFAAALHQLRTAIQNVFAVFWVIEGVVVFRYWHLCEIDQTTDKRSNKQRTWLWACCNELANLWNGITFSSQHRFVHWTRSLNEHCIAVDSLTLFWLNTNNVTRHQFRCWHQFFYLKRSTTFWYQIIERIVTSVNKPTPPLITVTVPVTCARFRNAIIC